MYLGFWFYSGTVRPTDQEITTIEKIICYSQFPRGGAMTDCAGLQWGSTRVSPEAEARDSTGMSVSCSFCEKEQARQSKQARQV